MTFAEAVAAATTNHAGLEAAIAATSTVVESPAIDHQLGPLLERLALEWDCHVSETDALERLLAEKAPDPWPAVEELRDDHRALTAEIQALRRRLMAEDGCPTPGTRQEIASLLKMLVHHDHSGAKLL